MRLIQHQVHIEKESGSAAEGRDGSRTEREVRHEMSVHDIQVDPRQGQALDCRRAFREAGMIPGKDGRDK
jgi:hypothetical protein